MATLIELHYNKTSFVKVKQESIESKIYRNLSPVPSSVIWRTVFHRSLVAADIFALFLYRNCEGPQTSSICTFDVLFKMESFGSLNAVPLHEVSIKGLRFEQPSIKSHLHRYFLHWFNEQELQRFKDGKTIFKVDILNEVYQPKTVDAVQTLPPTKNWQLLFDELFTLDPVGGNTTEYVDLVSGDGRTFTCPKHHIISHSDVLRAMLVYQQHDLFKDRAQGNALNLKDVDGDVLLEILHFFYIGSVDPERFRNKHHLAIDCLIAGEKYMLGREFQKICEDAALLTVNAENAAEYFLLADCMTLSEILRCAGDFILQFMTKETEKD